MLPTGKSIGSAATSTEHFIEDALGWALLAEIPLTIGRGIYIPWRRRQAVAGGMTPAAAAAAYRWGFVRWNIVAPAVAGTAIEIATLLR